MRFTQMVRWLPPAFALLALMSAPLCGPETSEEKKKKKTVEVKAEVVDGKVVITDGDGKVRVIELKDQDGPVVWHQHHDGEDVKIEGNVMVLRGGQDDEAGDHDQNTFVYRHQDHDGEGGNFTVRSKAILVGPDGVQKEVILDGLGSGEFDVRMVPELSGKVLQWSPDMEASDVMVQLSALSGDGFMIGVSCQPAGETLRAHLNIEHGLVVESVMDDSPADGQLETHDILVQVDGDELTEVAQLVKAVQTAGEDEGELKLRVIREGKKIKVAVTPQKRDGVWVTDLSSELPRDFKFVVDGDMKFGDGITLESFGPGLIEVAGEKGESGDLQDQIEQLRMEIEQLRAKLDKK